MCVVMPRLTHSVHPRIGCNRRRRGRNLSLLSSHGSTFQTRFAGFRMRYLLHYDFLGIPCNVPAPLTILQSVIELLTFIWIQAAQGPNYRLFRVSSSCSMPLLGATLFTGYTIIHDKTTSPNTVGFASSTCGMESATSALRPAITPTTAIPCMLVIETALLFVMCYVVVVVFV